MRMEVTVVVESHEKGVLMLLASEIPGVLVEMNALYGVEAFRKYRRCKGNEGVVVIEEEGRPGVEKCAAFRVAEYSKLLIREVAELFILSMRRAKFVRRVATCCAIDTSTEE
jgi:hypothetical protein